MEIPTAESETCEFKQSLSDINGILETICAFLNKNGGELFLGISDDGKIYGVDIGRNTIENLSKTIKEAISPRKYPVVDVVQVSGRSVVKIIVPLGDEKPYFCKGKAITRLGKSNVVMSAEEVEHEYKKRLELVRSFEESKTGADVSKGSKTAFNHFYRNARETVKKTKFGNLLRNLELEKDKKFNVAGLVCFAKNPQGALPQFTFRCGLVKKGELVSIDLISGTIFEIIEKTFDYAKEKIVSRFEIVGTIRKTTYEYPLEALREAIVNSLVHRDLQFPSSNYLAIYEDHVEIRNPGELPHGLEIQQLKEEHPSIQRNKKIANVLYLAGYIENWGTGTVKMAKLCREAGLPDPEFVQEQGFFKVKFWKNLPLSNQRLTKALKVIKRRGSITSKAYAKNFNIGDRMARIDLSEMQEQGFLEKTRIGRKIVYGIKK